MIGIVWEIADWTSNIGVTQNAEGSKRSAVGFSKAILIPLAFDGATALGNQGGCTIKEKIVIDII